MALENLIRPLPASRPDGNPRVRTRRYHPTIAQEGNRVHRIRMEAKHLLRGFARKRPPDGGRVETAGQGTLAIGRNCNGPHG